MKILVTAGNTQTPVDEVRCITNVFTGRTGGQIAARAFDRGHAVALLTSHPEVLDAIPAARDALGTRLAGAEVPHVRRPRRADGGRGAERRVRRGDPRGGGQRLPRRRGVHPPRRRVGRCVGREGEEFAPGVVAAAHADAEAGGQGPHGVGLRRRAGEVQTRSRADGGSVAGRGGEGAVALVGRPDGGEHAGRDARVGGGRRGVGGYRRVARAELADYLLDRAEALHRGRA